MNRWDFLQAWYDESSSFEREIEIFLISGFELFTLLTQPRSTSGINELMIRRLRAFMHAWVSFTLVVLHPHIHVYIYIYFPPSFFFPYLMHVLNSLTHSPICTSDQAIDHFYQWSIAHFYGLWRCTNTHDSSMRRMVKESVSHIYWFENKQMNGTRDKRRRRGRRKKERKKKIRVP